MVIKYTPKIVIDELKNIKIENNLDKDADAFKKMVDFSRLGREANKMMKLDFYSLTIGRKRNK